MQQLTKKNCDADSVIKLSTEEKAELSDEIERKVKSAPDIDFSQHPSVVPDLTEDLRLGDNPLFSTMGKK